MTSSVEHFHFTLGPVQGFVAQARRTRDFWAGSFLLSWLAGVAMKAVMAQGGTIVFPKPDADYLAWLDGYGRGERPRQGGIPNRFKAEVGAGFKPADVVQSVQQAWQALAETVWRGDLSSHCQHSSTTRAIWDRQIDAFWEISWVLGEDDALLDRRKNWRSHLPPAEPGIKCAMMAGWQELSGLSSPDAKTRDDFWQPLRGRFRRDLAESEALCAIAFVKRRFAHHFERVRADMPGGWTLRGWRLDTRVPSVLDLAAANWLARIVREEPDEAALSRFHQAARQLFPDASGIGELRCVWEAYRSRGGAMQDLCVPNSDALFAHKLDNPKECPDQAGAQAMKQAIRALVQQEPPSPFYAVLLMDGDSLGSLLRQPDAQPKVSKALEDFTREAPNLVDRHNGFLIYAGGDDVLALLPLEDAMRCAADLRQHYLESFRVAFGRGDNPSTLSGAIEYAHVKMPLTRILRDAHVLLDEVAKDGRGRDALAVRVWKPGGKALEWAMPWEKALDSAGQLEIERIAAQFAGDEAEFSSKFFYKIRERFEFLNPKSTQSGLPEEPAIFSESQTQALLAVDYLASGVNAGRETQLKLADAERLVGPLLAQCRPVFRRPGEPEPFLRSQRLEVDGALLVRFLAHKGMERR